MGLQPLIKSELNRKHQTGTGSQSITITQVINAIFTAIDRLRM